jgi:hypothetical protein
MQQNDTSPQPGPSGPGIGPRQPIPETPKTPEAKNVRAEPSNVNLLEGNVSDVDERPLRINETNFESKGPVINLVYQTKYKPGVNYSRINSLKKPLEPGVLLNGLTDTTAAGKQEAPTLDLGFAQVLGLAPQGTPTANGGRSAAAGSKRNHKTKTTYAGYESPEFLSRKNSVEMTSEGRSMIREFLKLPEIYPLLMNKELQLAVLLEPISNALNENRSIFAVEVPNHDLAALKEPKQLKDIKVVLSDDKAGSLNDSTAKKSKVTEIRQGSHDKKAMMHVATIAANTSKMKETKNPKPAIAPEDLITDYVPICVFLASALKITAYEAKLHKELTHLDKQFRNSTTSNIIRNGHFARKLLMRLLNHEEQKIFKLAISSFKDLNIFLNKPTLHELIEHSSAEYFEQFFTAYLDSYKEGLDSQQLTLLSLEHEVPQYDQSEDEDMENHLTRSKFIHFIRYALVFFPKKWRVWEAVHALRIPEELALRLFYATGEEQAIIDMLSEFPESTEKIKVSDIIQFKLYRLLLLYDPMALIEVFNTPANPMLSKRLTLYDHMCHVIEQGSYVETLCNVIIYVSETFWDDTKINKFFKALRTTLYNKEADWLSYIQNPLLYCMTMVYFFQRVKEQLDFYDNEMEEISENMLQFCKDYIECASEETLNLNLADKDGTDNGFLDYAFMIKDMNILSSDPIEDRIYQMWDLGRHTKQTINEFMRVISMDPEEKFNMDWFKKDFSIAIEDGDEFQWDYQLTSQSVFMKVISELFWPLILMLMELVFSIDLMEIHRFEGYVPDFATRFINSRSQTFLIILLIFRFSFITSCVIRTLAIQKIYSKTHYLQIFYNLCIAISFLQFVIFPLFLSDNFTFFNLTEACFVLCLMVYIFFNALSLNYYGVLLRIFASMAFVVVVFGTVSYTIIVTIAFAIQTLFLPFSQPISGQIYADLNLYSDIYQGICTLYEFVFGAVVLVRPYREQNMWTYTLTFVMVLFSFFGNIMMANLLVAFLTSQFDKIQQNAKYLTMNMQFELIQVLRPHHMDTLISLPFILIIPAIPFYIGMAASKQAAPKINSILKKMIHVVNVFVPIFTATLLMLVINMPLKYIEVFIVRISRVFAHSKGLIYFVVWTFLGWVLLLKLFFLDLWTLIGILLDFNKPTADIDEYELDYVTRKNVLAVFRKFSKAAKLLMKRGFVKCSGRQFLDTLNLSKMQQALLSIVTGLNNPSNVLGQSKLEDGMADQAGNNQPAVTDDIEGLKFKDKYMLPERLLTPLLIRKYSDYTSKYPSFEEMKIDLNFMRNKFKHNLTKDKVHRLVAFEKLSISKASQSFKSSQVVELKDDFKQIETQMESMEQKLGRTFGKLREFRERAGLK